ncbi:MAG: hypothetical protein MK116_07100 [Phycisphaerales bacterium]|nr:hypothetical protein [Phycisphaerales bacterium]
MKIFLLLLLWLFPDPAPTIQWNGAHCGVEDRRLELITDDQALDRAWRLIHGDSPDGMPDVNFDRCRLVLAINGREPGVHGVHATEISRNDQEAVLSIDARPGRHPDVPGAEETTAWGLFIVPRTPDALRVRVDVSSPPGGEPRWVTAAVFDGGERQDHDGDRGAPRAAGDHGNGATDGFQPDLSLLQPRRASDRDPDISGSPHAVLFRRGNKELLFIGAAHQRDIENDPTHRMVRAAIEGFEPDVVIVEGLTTSQGPQPERFIASARRRLKTGQLGESPYAAVLADDRGAIVIGGEPDPEATTSIVREAGYSDDDLLGFLVARNVTSIVRNDREAANDPRRIGRAITNLKRRFKVDSDMDVDGFKAWFQERTGQAFDPRRVRREVSPMKVDDPSILRQIAILAMKAREYNLVELEARMLQEHDRVMVVYGSGHLRWERRLLEQMLGEPILVTDDLSPEHFEMVHAMFEEHLQRLREPWTRELDSPPSYFVSHGYDPRWQAGVQAGIDAARDVLGNYGPVQVYVVGQEDDELSDPAHQDEIAEAFCEIHNAGSDRTMADCLSSDGRDMADKAVDGASEAFMTMAMDSDPPRAELVFINAHTFGETDMPTRGIHEYTHVYQKAFEFTPTWMMEGGAELLACHLGEQHGWGERNQTMEWYAQSLARAEDLEYTIKDMEEIETASPDVARWHRELAYDAGAWAVAYLVDQSDSRSIQEYFLTYFPMVNASDWKQALCAYTGADSVESFYSDFEVFMDQPLEDRLLLLDRLKD